MLPSLEIKNFRTFGHLRIKQLGQVNLIVGKNNVGKTTLLEALQLYGSVWPARTAAGILSRRDEVAGKLGNKPSLLLRSIFHGRNGDVGAEAFIGPLESTAEQLEISSVISSYAEDEDRSNPWGSGGSGGSASTPPDLQTVLRFALGELSGVLLPSGGIRYGIPNRIVKPPEIGASPPFLRGTGGPTANAETAGQWGDIALTAGEQRVLDIVHIIAPVRGVAFVPDPRELQYYIAKAGLEGMSDPVPLASLGDGVVRVFQIAVLLQYAAIIGQAETKSRLPANVFPLALFDEIDSGIHYSIQADLLRFLIKGARELGVQVFATTHSWDCVTAFQEAAENDPDFDGMLIRLEASRGKSRAVSFSKEELKIVTREEIEVR